MEEKKYGKMSKISQEKVDKILKAITSCEDDFIRAKNSLIQVEKFKLKDKRCRYRLIFNAENIYGLYFHNESRSYKIKAIAFGDTIRIYVGR